MFQTFLDSLANNAANVLTIALVVGVLAAVLLFWRSRRSHVQGIRRRLNGQINMPGRVKEALAKALNADVAEVGTIGAVSFVDLAWHYSMADPSIWDHFTGPTADHMADAIQNLDVLKGALGDQAMPVVGNIVDYLRGLEALQVFDELVDKLPVVADSSAIVLDSHSGSLVDTLVHDSATSAVADAKAGEVAGMLTHIPLVTIGFATYRAWRRSQKGAALGRNFEFAAVEVTTRASGGLAGGKMGGAIGTFVVPGIGTIVGTVVGAVAGAVGGALLGESVKKRHVQRANEALNEQLSRLGGAYLEDPANFMRVTDVFRDQESEYREHLQETRRRLRRYSMPWRVAWPDEKLVLLQETVRLAEDRLGTLQEGTVEAIDRLAFMRETGQKRELGIMLWSNPALCAEVPCDTELIAGVQHANEHFERELRQLGVAAA